MPTQTTIPGTIPDLSCPELDEALDRKHKLLAERKLLTEALHVLDDKCIELMQENEIRRYPFTDPTTQRKKYLVLDSAAKLRSVAAKSARAEQHDEEFERGARETRVTPGRDRFGQPVVAGDPFAATRDAMADDGGAR